MRAPGRRPRTIAATLLAAPVVALLLAGCSSSASIDGGTLPPLGSGTLTTPPLTVATLPATTDAATTTVETLPPTVPTSAPASTTGPATTSATSSGVSWGGWPYYEVPRMGAESVRGTGCGSTGQLGDVVPDGIWNVLVSSWTPAAVTFDVRCVYTGEGGQQLWDTQCVADPSVDACLTQAPSWFVVNNSTRLRSMPPASGVRYGVGGLGTSPCPGAVTDPGSPAAAWRSMDSWLVVDGGRVVAVVSACPAG